MENDSTPSIIFLDTFFASTVGTSASLLSVWVKKNDNVSLISGRLKNINAKFMPVGFNTVNDEYEINGFLEINTFD